MGLFFNNKFFKIFFLHALIVLVKSERDFRLFKNSKLFIDDDRVKLITEDDSVAFFVIGDWGGLPVFPFRTLIENAVSDQMTKLAQLYNTQFQLALGDNFYFNGVRDLDDKRFKNTYEDVFKTEHLQETSWFVILGNHDHYGNASAQLDYMSKSKRWIIPSYNYTVDVKTKQGKQDLITMLMIDTVLLCGNSGFDWEPHKQPKLYRLKDKIRSNNYLDSVEKELKRISETDVPYILVSGHFPVWSVAEHGPTQCLVDKLRPLLHKYQVSAYFCGHDHNLQHINDNYLDHTVDYILSGAANFVDNSTEHMNNVPEKSLKFFWADNSHLYNGGFVLSKANENNMTLTFYESTGKELYQTVIYPRKI